MGKTIQDYQNDYKKAYLTGDTNAMNAAHIAAEALRNAQGYSGGTDGSSYIPLNASGTAQTTGLNYIPTSSPSLPNNMINDHTEAVNQSANNMINSAMSMAGNYLQGLKTLAGKPADQPARTMEKEQMDLNNALTRVDAYANATGKIPGMDFLNAVGLQGTFGDVAGQPTYATQQDALANALKVASASRSSSGSGSKGRSGSGSQSSSSGSDSGLPSTLTERKDLATSQTTQAANSYYNGLVGKLKYPLYYTINSLLNDPNQISSMQAAGVNTQTVIDSLIRSKTGLTPKDYFNTNTGLKLKGAYNNLVGSKNAVE